MRHPWKKYCIKKDRSQASSGNYGSRKFSYYSSFPCLMLHLNLQEKPKALQYFNKAVLYNKNISNAYYQRGLIYKEYNNFEQTIKDIKQSAELEPDNAIVLNELGLVHQTLGDLENALYYYKKACSIDFYNIEYRHNLGLALFEMKKYQEAIVELKRIIRFTPDNADIHFNLAQIFELTKNYREAIESFENFLRIKGAKYENKDQITARIKYLEDCFYINV